MRSALTSTLLLALGGCVAGNPPGVGGGGDDGDDLLGGGTLPLAGCDHDLTTRPGASAPVVGTPMLGAEPAPFHLHLGLAADPATSIVVTWRTDLATRVSTARFGVGDALDRVVEGATFTYQAGLGSEIRERVHEAHLCGLSPDTEYSYQVGGVGPAGEAWSPVHRFRTAPAADDPDAEVVLLNIGDSRDGYDVWQQMTELAAEHAPDLLLFSGDAVTLGQLQAEWDAFFGVAEPLLATIPIVSAHGNHDVNAAPYYALFAMPGDEEHYGFDYGPAHVTVLNDSPDQLADIRGKAASLLAADLAAIAGDPWKLVMHHRPIWSAAANHGGDPELLEAFGPLFDQHQVDLVLNGHDHDYERTKPMRGEVPQASAADGTIYVVSGGAGATLYDNGSDFWTEVSAKAHSMLIIRARRDELEMTALTETGSELDHLVIPRAP